MAQLIRTVGSNGARLRIGLMRGDDPHNEYLHSLLAARFDLRAVVIEPGREQRRRLWRQRKYRDALASEYHHMRRSLLGLDRYRKTYFDSIDAPEIFSATPPVVSRWINNTEVVDMAKVSDVDIWVITCVSKLSPTLLSVMPSPIINIHGGHLPDYRGCHCYFFALLEERFEKVGSTIHLVEKGLDTGPIIEACRPPIRHDDNAERLYCRGERMAAERLVEILEEYEGGRPIEYAPQAFRGRLILRRQRQFGHDLLFSFRRMTGRLKLPDQPGSRPVDY